MVHFYKLQVTQKVMNTKMTTNTALLSLEDYQRCVSICPNMIIKIMDSNP